MVRKAFTVLAVVALAACNSERRLVVGSKNFTEQLILGEIVAQHVENRLGIHVQRKLNLGGTLLAHGALQAGSIDLYPEYTGTALTAVLKQAPQPDPKHVFQMVQAGYNQWNLKWLAPFGFNNTFAMVVREDVQLQTLSEAAVAPGKTWRLGAGYEFLKRADGLEGLLKTYPLHLEGRPKAMDLGLLYTALNTHKVDIAAANSTDGMLSVLKLKILEDDRHYFPPYECAVVVRQQALNNFDGLEGVLLELSGKLPADVMRQLNYLVDGKHQPVRSVAKQFLKDFGR